MAQMPLKDAGNLFIFLGIFGLIFGIVLLFTQEFFKENLYIIGGSIAAILLGYGSIRAVNKAEEDRWKNL
tara:strand:- start:421 stop:630 length:210 start_codon:yes stop_codon:yes gene_type:complete